MADRKWTPCVKSHRFHLIYELETTKVEEGLPSNKCEDYFETFYDEARQSYAYNDNRKRK